MIIKNNKRNRYNLGSNVGRKKTAVREDAAAHIEKCGTAEPRGCSVYGWDAAPSRTGFVSPRGDGWNRYSVQEYYLLILRLPADFWREGQLVIDLTISSVAFLVARAISSS